LFTVFNGEKVGTWTFLLDILIVSLALLMIFERDLAHLRILGAAAFYQLIFGVLSIHKCVENDATSSKYLAASGRLASCAVFVYSVCLKI